MLASMPQCTLGASHKARFAPLTSTQLACSDCSRPRLVSSRETCCSATPCSSNSSWAEQTARHLRSSAVQRCLRPSSVRIQSKFSTAASKDSVDGLRQAPSAASDTGKGASWVGWALAAAVAAGGVALYASGQGAIAMDLLANGPLGRSGFLAAFSLIFLSEIGDKTFFIAAILAMKLGKWVSFLGSLASLASMSVISVAIGALFSKVPDALKSSIPVGEVAGCTLLVLFGLKALNEGLKSKAPGDSMEGSEMEDATSTVDEFEISRGAIQRSSPFLQSFLQVFGLIFIAEWGDRSMLATIALGAAQNPLGVAAGAVAGHAAATGIAVLGGAIAANYVSERTVNIISGVLFLIFAIATGAQLL